jgi:hypothetical protein
LTTNEIRNPHCESFLCGSVIGGGKTSADSAALGDFGLVRSLDLLDSDTSHDGLCHPSGVDLDPDARLHL